MTSVKRWVWIASFSLLVNHALAQSLPDGREMDASERFAAWSQAAEQGEALEVLLQRHYSVNDRGDEGQTVAHLAARFGRLDWLRQLPEKLLSTPSDQDNLPVHEAAWAGQLQALQWLAGQGADLSAANRHQWQPLHMAVFNERKQVVRWLLSRHVPVNSVTREGWTPLALAISQGQCDLIPMLRAAGAQVDQSVTLWGRQWPLKALAAKLHPECQAALD